MNTKNPAASRVKRLTTGFVLLAALTGCSVGGSEPDYIEMAGRFERVVNEAVASQNARYDALHSPVPAITPRPASAPPRPVLEPQAKVETPRPPATGRSVTGTATWYCLAGVSPCHFARSGGMYAAAGGEIRKGDWRGRKVRVCAGDDCITVTLIDWCACGGNRIIDLYSDAFRKLAPLGSGVIDVKVKW